MKNNIFKAIVDSRSQEEVAAAAMRTTIRETVIFNTSVKERVDKDYYEIITNVAEKLMKAKKVIMFIGDSKEEFAFYNGGEILKNLQKMYMKLMDFGFYYEDSDEYISNTGLRFSGFCWKYSYNGRTTKCGIYSADETATEEEADTAEFNCEGEECEW